MSERLQRELGAREVAPLVARLGGLVEGLTLVNALDGLALFVNADIARVFPLPLTSPDVWTRRGCCSLRRRMRPLKG